MLKGKRIKNILKEVPLEMYRGNKEVVISGLSQDSRFVAPGDMFIAKKGHSDDGAKYITSAIENGAIAVLATHGDPFLKVTQLIHPNIQAILGKLASSFYDHPSQKLFTVGITGTNGKTTTSYLIKHLLDHFDMATGLIGTVEYLTGNVHRDANITTPDVISNHKMLKEMVQAGCQGAVLEVSSHGLIQGRVDEIDFDVAIFTNLTHEHLDYHKTIESYAEAKQLLFSSLKKEKTAVVNIDSPWAKKMIEKSSSSIITYGLSQEADFYAHHLHITQEGTSFCVTYKGETVPFSWHVIGKYNVYNCLAAIATLCVKGISLSELVPFISTFRGAPGRLERVGNSKVFVDFAHTPDALENVLKALQEFKKGRIITIFGCGGERDKKKRPLMAEIAERFSDITIVTTDNPRSEDPSEILKEIVQGFKKDKFVLESDRREAIRKAIALAHKDDLILIAGKGHETYQIYASKRIVFDDRKVAEEYLR